MFKKDDKYVRAGAYNSASVVPFDSRNEDLDYLWRPPKPTRDECCSTMGTKFRSLASVPIYQLQMRLPMRFLQRMSCGGGELHALPILYI